MQIRKSVESDKAEIEKIHRAAFGKKEGPIIADLVTDMFADKTALPLLSLVMEEHGKLIGHIIYSKVTLAQANKSVSAQILAPLAVHPMVQKKVIGKVKGQIHCSEALNHPEYWQE